MSETSVDFGSAADSGDMDYDFTCTTCLEDKLNAEASYYCKQCSRHYCEKCIQMHNKFSRSHHVLDRTELKLWGKVKDTITMATCERENHGHCELQMYCRDHDVICCHVCVSQEHRSCKGVQTVIEAAKGIEIDSEFTDLPSKVQKISDRLSALKEKQEKNQLILQKLKESITQDIKTLRATLNQTLDRLESETVTELEKLYTEINNKLTEEIASCRQIHDELYHTLCSLDIERKMSEYEMFTGFKKCEQRLLVAESLLESVKTVDSSIKFSPDEKLLNSLSQIEKLGILEKTGTEAPAEQTKHKKHGLEKGSGTQVSKFAIEYNIHEEGDEFQASISGICQLPCGNIVLVDNENCKVKRLNKHYQVMTSVTIPAYPQSICYIGNHKLAVTVRAEDVRDNGIHCLDTRHGKLNPVKRIPLQHPCQALAFHNNHFYIGSNTKVYVYTVHGQLVRELFEDSSASLTVYNLAVSENGSRILIANSTSNTLLTLDSEGKQLQTFTNSELLVLTGVCIGHRDEIFLCGYNSHNVLKVSPGGKQSFLATQTDGLTSPKSLYFNRTSSELLVGQFSDQLVVIKKMK